MKLEQLSVALASLLMASLALGAAAAVPAAIAAAVADPSRPAGDVQRDVNRKPAEVLAFSGVKPGDKVGELIPARGYFTKLFCKIVGDSGHVYAVGIRPAMRPGGGAPPSDMPGAARQGGPGGPPAAPPPEPTAGTPCTNVTSSNSAPAEFALPAGLDIVWTSENYHDLASPNFAVDLAAFNKTIFNALKPGGVYMVEDHAAAAGSGVAATGTLHRVDKAAVVAAVTAAGFKLDGESTVLANPADDHTVASRDLNGKSDKFLLKFRKPAR
jgi:predicted methyltransferase